MGIVSTNPIQKSTENLGIARPGNPNAIRVLYHSLYRSDGEAFAFICSQCGCDFHVNMKPRFCPGCGSTFLAEKPIAFPKAGTQ